MAHPCHSRVLLVAFQTSFPSVPAKMVGEQAYPKGRAEATKIFSLFVYPDLARKGQLINK